MTDASGGPAIRSSLISIVDFQRGKGKNSMTYQQDRDQAYLDRLQDQITDFISSYNANPNADHTTIFLFPGRLASKLMRAEAPGRSCRPTTWPGSIPRSLAARSTISSVPPMETTIRTSSSSRIRISIDGVTPNDGIIPWCRSNALDLFIFGWDWRLTTESSADFFLKRFLPLFEQRTKACHPNPLEISGSSATASAAS